MQALSLCAMIIDFSALAYTLQFQDISMIIVQCQAPEMVHKTSRTMCLDLLA